MRVRNTIAIFSASLLCVIVSTQISPCQTRQYLAQNESLQSGPRQTETQPQVPRLTVPTDDVLLILIRASLIALNQANATGNYTVLRDWGAPSFKEANSADKLARIFANMRERKLDLALILLVQPKLYRKPVVTPKGILRITGFFPTDQERINFDLMFQPVQGRWRLFGIAANPAEPQQTRPNLEVEGGPPPEAAISAKPTEPSAEENKPETTATTGSTKARSASEVDIRDRIDNPSLPPPENEKPKEKSIWNPFDR